MEIIKVIILGIVQGFTEFLPVSSSGHLVIAAEFLNFQEKGIAFEVFVHLGTLFSVLIAFRQDIFQMALAPFRIFSPGFDTSEAKKYFLWDICIVVGTIPAAVIGLLFKSQLEEAFSSFLLVLLMLIVTGTFLLLSRFAPKKSENLSIGKSLLIGIAQAIAILPGISRSGSTIVSAVFLGLDRENAAKFSFLLGIPAILGASVIKINDLLTIEPSQVPLGYLLIGALAAFISGYMAIFWLLAIVKRGKLEWFGYYCFFIVIVSAIVYYLVL
jgi:undecaprenyl-diphosphatase